VKRLHKGNGGRMKMLVTLMESKRDKGWNKVKVRE